MAAACSTKEISKGFYVTNPAVRAQVDIGAESYRVITVFNETDQDILVDYKNESGNPGSFYVPKNGRAFTRVINGNLLSNSLNITALAPATGRVFINLGN